MDVHAWLAPVRSAYHGRAGLPSPMVNARLRVRGFRMRRKAARPEDLMICFSRKWRGAPPELSYQLGRSLTMRKPARTVRLPRRSPSSVVAERGESVVSE